VDSKPSVLLDEVPDPSGRLLTQVAHRHADGSAAFIESPVVPLLDTSLMTNAPGEPRLGAQLISEIPSADQVDLIMAFIRRSGIAPMREALGQHLSTGTPKLSRQLGDLSKIFKKAEAAPVGLRLPCSQLRGVSKGTLMRRAKSGCVNPKSSRMPRT